jgi:hypothetical protein
MPDRRRAFNAAHRQGFRRASPNAATGRSSAGDSHGSESTDGLRFHACHKCDGCRLSAAAASRAVREVGPRSRPDNDFI